MSHPLKRAVDTLAGVCDGAVSEDGMGFNRYDADFGHRLASTPWEDWSPKMRRAAYEMVRKYRDQLRVHNIEYDEIPEPDPEPETRGPRRTITLGEGPEEGLFLIRFPYERGLVEAVKEKVDGRAWNPDAGRWEAPASPLAAAGIRDLTAEHNFDVGPRAEALLEKLASRIEDLGRRYIELTEAGHFNVRFPYDEEVKDDLKQRVPSSNWTGEVWAVNETDADSLLEFADDHDFSWTDDAREAAEQAVERAEAARQASRAAENGGEPLAVEERLGGTLYPFQRVGVEYATEMERVLIADQMGLGKTVQALAAVEAEEAFPAIVVCPASVKRNWAREARKWLPDNRRVAVLDGTTPHAFRGDLIVLNYAILDDWLGTLQDREPEAVVLDESHYVKNSSAKRSHAARMLAREAPMRLLLTGTPVLNRPSELIHQLKVLGRFEDVGGSWRNYVDRYCQAHHDGYGWDVSGASNLDELNDRLRARCYVRRRKEEVLKDLPDKQRAEVPVDIDNRDEYRQARDNLIAWLREERGKDAAARASRAEQLSRIAHLKQLAARGKLAAARRWIEDFLESGEKLVVFAHHREVQEALYEAFADRAVWLTGGMAADARQEAVDRFQSDERVRLFVGSLKAAGVGITLTAASDVAFLELGWTPADHDQAEDRVHRIGQEGAVNAWYLLAENTIDEEIARLIASKRRVVDQATEGGEVDEAAMLDELIDSLLEEE